MSPHRSNWCCFVVKLVLLQFTLFKTACFVAIYVLSWFTYFYVENKWQIWGMIDGLNHANNKQHDPFHLFSHHIFCPTGPNEEYQKMTIKENVCFSSAFSFHVCFRESFREGHRECQREIWNIAILSCCLIVILPHCHCHVASLQFLKQNIEGLLLLSFKPLQCLHWL